MNGSICRLQVLPVLIDRCALQASSFRARYPPVAGFLHGHAGAICDVRSVAHGDAVLSDQASASFLRLKVFRRRVPPASV